ncbi:MAG: hypothetical protein LBV51_00115, partial [Acholeplasmatales bacterium]|nr:hypothetical protein [Acholeplasmatales bacterium]
IYSAAYILIPYIIIVIAQFSLLVLLIVSLIYFIVTAVKRKSFSNVITKLTSAFIVIYIFSIITIGTVTLYPALALVACAISVVTLKVFDYISSEKSISINKLIPNIIGTAAIVISLLFLNGLSKISYSYSSYYETVTISGILKFSYAAEGISNYGFSDYYVKVMTYVVINLMSYLTTMVILCVFIPIRISDTLQKVKIPTKVLGWVAVFLLIMLSITNLLFGSFLSENYSPKPTYGFTVVVLLLILVTQIVDSINVPEQDVIGKLN